MKKTAMIFVLVLFAGTAFADVSFTLYRGWNLVPMGILGSECTADNKNVSAVYFYSPLENNYLGVPVTQSGSPQKEYQDKVDAVRRLYEPKKNEYLTPFETGTSAWAYYTGNNSCNTTIRTSNPYTELSTRKLFRGWNFLTVLPWMVDKKLTDITYGCDIQRFATWDAAGQKWNSVRMSLSEWARQYGPDNPVNESSIGQTILLKTAGECALSATGPLPPAPPLPD